MISDEFALEVLRALADADRFGMSLADLAAAVWAEEKPRNPRQHSVLGVALQELKERKLVVSSGGKKARWALTPAGERWLDGYRVVPGDEPAQGRGPAYRESMPLDPLQIAVEEACQRPTRSQLPPNTPGWLAYAHGKAEGRARAEQTFDRIRQASRSQAEYDAAMAEVNRRTQQQLAELEREIRAKGFDPHAYG